MKQKQSQRVVVNINQAFKAKRKRRAKKAKARTQLPTQPTVYIPMPQSVIRYYDNTIPQRSITFNPPVLEQPKILQGVQADTEYAQPVRAERKPIKVPTPLPETESVLLREEPVVGFGGDEAPSAREVIEEQPAPEQPAEAPEEEKPKRKKKEKLAPREVADEFKPTFTQQTSTAFPLPPLSPAKFPPTLEPIRAEEPEPDELQKDRGSKTRKPRAVDPPWYKEVKKDFAKANEEERQYDLRENLTESMAGRRYDKRRSNYIQSIGQDTAGFRYATPPVPKVEASGGGFSFVGK